MNLQTSLTLSASLLLAAVGNLFSFSHGPSGTAAAGSARAPNEAPSGAATTSAPTADFTGQSELFINVVTGAARKIPHASDGLYVVPNERELADWKLIAEQYQAGRLDECRLLLAKYNYTLSRIGEQYDMFAEQAPIMRGWGTFIYNRKSTRRLNVHVNHPIEDQNAALIGAEMFSRMGGKWFLMAGSSKHAMRGSLTADAALQQGTVFQFWHERVSDLAYITVSLHGYEPARYGFPIRESDIIISNGRTTDEQWGISQISLNLRDSLRKVGFQTALAMLDSGFSRLAGGGSRQGVFSNDKFGFGHWLYVELSNTVRYSADDYDKFIDVADAVLKMTGEPLGKQINHAFGLVSPRVLKLDAGKAMRFDTPQPETYRIISTGAGDSMADTLDLLFGNWIDGVGKNRSLTRVVRYDSGALAAATEKSSRRTISTVVQNAKRKHSSGIRPAEHEETKRKPAQGEEPDFNEPIQVHRIPLQPVLASTVAADYIPAMTPFRWGGILPENFTPQVLTYGRNVQNTFAAELVPGLDKFLIPLLNSSYDPSNRHFVGVQMTEMLVNEIARLVQEYDAEGYEIGLLAEQSDTGNYFLRLFTSVPSEELGGVNP